MELVGLTVTELVVVCLSALAGGMIRGFTGFGSALVIAPILSIAVGTHIAVPAIVLVLFVSTFQLIPSAARDANWRQILPLGLAGAVGAPIGVYALISIDQELMRRFIAVVVVAFAAAMLAGWRYKREPSSLVTIGVGGIGGVLSGAASVGGPPVIVFLLAGPGGAAANRAAIIHYFFFAQTVVIAMYWIEGMLVAKVLWLAVLMLPTQMIGVAVGTKLFPKSNETLYRRVALSFLLLIGLAALAA
jgi:hypothetical protein